jgi:hypothetical protein
MDIDPNIDSTNEGSSFTNEKSSNIMILNNNINIESDDELTNASSNIFSNNTTNNTTDNNIDNKNNLNNNEDNQLNDLINLLSTNLRLDEDSV